MAAGVDDILSGLIARVGRVRSWLLALSTLRIAALGLACLSTYVVAYAWLDHHVHFGLFGRASAFVLLLGLIVLGVCRVVRVLRRDMTYAHAANYIEAKRSFDQQLVAAVEYYEGRNEYPYSKVLAAQLVRQVDAAAQEYRFDSTIGKWQGYLLASFVIACVCVVGFFVHQNVLYISSYLARLIRPFAAIEPVPATVLEPSSGDLVAGVDDPVELAVSVQGRVPDTLTLVLTRRDPNDGNQPPAPEVERIELTPNVGADGKTGFTATRSFGAAGEIEYRFESPGVRSEPHLIRVCEQPAIESVKAKISPPARAGASPIEPYEQEMTDQPLAVLPGSRIELKAQASTALREALLIMPDGTSQTQPLNGADSFGFELTANQPSSIKLGGVSADGLPIAQATELEIAIKSDELPQFKLVSPEGDYLATDVSSIPISFEVTDDFGLDSAQLICELPGQEPTVLEPALPQRARQVSLTHVLDLERYDLHVGDTILFYVKAADVDTGHRPGDANACSEVYFIEIRPYRQYWHPLPGGSQPGSMPGPAPEDLITILEYTRAIVKKAWTLARSTAKEDPARLEALASDVQYCATRLAKTRDDPESGFSEGDKAVLDEVLKSYEQAKRHLERHDALAALPPAQEAYRILRMFIDELNLNWAPPQSGESSPQETPERVKLQEQPPQPQMEKERIEGELQEMQQRIDSLTRQQESLKTDLARALQKEEEAKARAKSGDKAGSERSSENGVQEQSADARGASDQQGRSGTGEQDETQTSKGEGGSSKSGDSAGRQGQQAGEQGQTPAGQSGPSGSSKSSESRSRQKQRASGQGPTGSGQKGQPGNEQNGRSHGGPGGKEAGQAGQGSDRSAAQADARMRMLQAKEKALREQVSQLSEQLSDLAASEHSDEGRAGRQAKEYLDQAGKAMKQLEDELADARFRALDSSDVQGMADSADAASRKLAEAAQAIRQGLSNEGKGPSDKAQEMAEQLARDAEAYDESLSEAEKQKMLDRLKAAERLLESMAGAQWTTMSRGGGPGASHVLTNDSHSTAADTARLLARQFWSMALESKKRQMRPVEGDASDVEFFEVENDFFEDAARFRPEDDNK